MRLLARQTISEHVGSTDPPSKTALISQAWRGLTVSSVRQLRKMARGGCQFNPALSTRFDQRDGRDESALRPGRSLLRVDGFPKFVKPTEVGAGPVGTLYQTMFYAGNEDSRWESSAWM